MRTKLLLIAFLFLTSAAFAEEVALEIRTIDADSPLGAVKAKDMQFESASKPDGAKVPDGEIVWGKLILGKHSHILCMTKKGNKLARLYLDSDGDKDFKEETPVEAKLRGQIPYFALDGITGEFKVGNGSVSGKMRVWVVPAARGYIYLFTGLFGEIEAAGNKFSIAWVPGKPPFFRLASWKTGVSVLYAGRKKITIDEKSLSVKDGVVTVKYTAAEEKDLVEVQVPEGLTIVELYHMRNAVACLPSDGKLFLPEGSYSIAYATFDKESEGASYSLNILLGTGGFIVKKGMSVLPAEPLNLSLTVEQKGAQVSIGTSLSDASKRNVAIFKDGKQVSAPKLKVTDSEGNIVATYKYKPG
jgi:hypothetical protein